MITDILNTKSYHQNLRTIMTKDQIRKTSREYLQDAYKMAESRGLSLSVQTDYKTFDDDHVVFIATVSLSNTDNAFTYYVQCATGHKLIKKTEVESEFTACETMAVGRACMFLLGITEFTIVEEEYANVLQQTISRIKELYQKEELSAVSFIDGIRDKQLKEDCIKFYATLNKVELENLPKSNKSFLDGIL